MFQSAEAHFCFHASKDSGGHVAGNAFNLAHGSESLDAHGVTFFQLLVVFGL